MRRVFILLLPLLFMGCTYYAPPGENHAARVITAVEVTATEQGTTHHYRYTTESKVRTLMTYLRRIKPELSANIDPASFRTDRYCITLCLSDGTTSQYRQVHTEYLQKDGGPWRSIDPAHGSALARLLKELPSDG